MPNNENKMTFEQFLIGALLKFKELDSVDINTLLDIYTSTYNVTKLNIYFPSFLNEFLIKENGGLKLKEDYLDNSFAKNSLENFASKKVLNYFKKLDINEYIKRKEQELSNYKETLLNEANILLISDNENDYNEMINYGFKNIDYFKSIIRADKYFSLHKEELEKYHIVIEGHLSTYHTMFDTRLDLQEVLSKLQYRNNLKVYKVKNYDDMPNSFIIDLKNDKIHEWWQSTKNSRFKIFDSIVENTYINDVLQNKKTKFTPIKQEEHEALPLPKTLSDLKILYLEPLLDLTIDKYKDTAESLGLNITFMNDNNYSLVTKIQNNLGYYDIIIASNEYSHNLLYMNKENTEQCKDTGRNLTLLVTYDEHYSSSYDEEYKCIIQGLGSKINLNYIFGGPLASNDTYETKTFKVLRETYSKNDIPPYLTEYIQSFKAIISESINLYNNTLKENQKQTLTNLSLKTAKEYDDEYSKIEKQESNVVAELRISLNTFKALRDYIIKYLEYKNIGLITSNIEGINIIEKESTILVENIFEGKILCRITFSKDLDPSDNLLIFTIETLTNKGKLSGKEIVGIYPRRYEGLDNTPKRPNDKQMNAINGTYKTIKKTIPPLLDEAEKLEKQTLSHKKRKRNYN